MDSIRKQDPGKDFPNRCQSGQKLPEGQQVQTFQRGTPAGDSAIFLQRILAPARTYL